MRAAKRVRVNPSEEQIQIAVTQFMELDEAAGD